MRLKSKQKRRHFLRCAVQYKTRLLLELDVVLGLGR